MKKYKIELSEEQMKLVSFCLEDISRFASGQCNLTHTMNEMLSEIPPEERMKRIEKVDKLLKEVKKVLLPELSDNGIKGFNDSEFIGNTYQIYRNILHKLAIDNDWDNVYSSIPLPSGNMGSISISEIKETTF